MMEDYDSEEDDESFKEDGSPSESEESEEEDEDEDVEMEEKINQDELKEIQKEA
jgi:hypothetical protein